jgi:hypothetical protein
MLSKNQKIGGARYIGLALGVIALLGATQTLANVFPKEAVSVFIKVAGEQEFEWLASAERTILGVRMQQSGGTSRTIVFCGTEEIAQNWAKDYPQDLMQKYCNLPIKIKKTGDDTAFISLTYMPFDIATASDLGNFSDDLASVSGIAPLKTFGFMTAGDILIALLLFGLAMLNLLTIFLRKI